MSKNTKKNGVPVTTKKIEPISSSISLSISETRTITRELTYNINPVTLDIIKKQIDNAITEVELDEELDIEQKAKKIERITVENYVNRLVTSIENSLIAFYALKDGIQIDNHIINTDKKRITGKTMLIDKEFLQKSVQEFLLTGFYGGKRLMMRNARYQIGITEGLNPRPITIEFISVPNFNKFNKSDKDKAKNAKKVFFGVYQII